jgi:SnoaL-like domain
MTDRPPPPSPSDTDALRVLSAEYAAAVDGRDGEAFAALFTPSGELVVPDVPDDLNPVVSRAGRESLRQVPEELRRFARTFHQVSDHRFVFKGERATGEVRCVAHHVAVASRGHRTRGRSRGKAGDSVGTDTVWFIRYVDDYVRAPGGWRFERRVLHLEWIEEHPVTVLPPAPSPGASPGGT